MKYYFLLLCITSTITAIAMRGVRVRPQYEDLINVAVSDELYNIKTPNRDAKFLREFLFMSQLDGEGA